MKQNYITKAILEYSISFLLKRRKRNWSNSDERFFSTVYFIFQMLYLEFTQMLNALKS